MTISPELVLIWFLLVIFIFFLGALMVVPEQINELLESSLDRTLGSVGDCISAVFGIAKSIIVKFISFPKYLRDRFSTKFPNRLEQENARLREENEQLRSRTNYR